MSDKSSVQPNDYRVEIAKSIEETREAIQEALGFIERQEDGPFTMRCALKEIDDRLSAIETEVSYLVGTVDWFASIALKLTRQRDEAIQQRALLIAMYGLPDHDE